MPCNLIMTPQEFEIELRNSDGYIMHSEYLTYPGPMQQTIAIALTQGMTPNTSASTPPMAGASRFTQKENGQRLLRRAADQMD